MKKIKSISVCLFITLILSSFQTIDKRKILKDNIANIKVLVAKNDLINLKKNFEPSAFKEFIELNKTITQRKKAILVFNNKPSSEDGDEILITGDGNIVTLKFKVNKWVIYKWDFYLMD
jgi:hypothetical protein